MINACFGLLIVVAFVLGAVLRRVGEIRNETRGLRVDVERFREGILILCAGIERLSHSSAKVCDVLANMVTQNQQALDKIRDKVPR